MNYSGIINCSIVDGEGFRVSLFISGCKHHCEGCHNKETWDFNHGKPYTEKVEEVLFDRLSSPHIKGLTLTGGDPLYILSLCDFIVDGMFNCNLKDYNTPYRGSSNQKIINLKTGEEVFKK